MSRMFNKTLTHKSVKELINERPAGFIGAMNWLCHERGFKNSDWYALIKADKGEVAKKPKKDGGKPAVIPIVPSVRPLWQIAQEMLNSAWPKYNFQGMDHPEGTLDFLRDVVEDKLDIDDLSVKQKTFWRTIKGKYHKFIESMKDEEDEYDDDYDEDEDIDEDDY